MANIQDGSATFKIRDLREEKLKQKMVDLVYPVGIVVAIANDNKPDFMNYGKWEKVAPGRTLWGADSSHSPGSTIEAGLPNITGKFTGAGNSSDEDVIQGGALIHNKANDIKFWWANAIAAGIKGYTFDASKSNEIYGKSETVQPPAYVVAYWQRTA